MFGTSGIRGEFGETVTAGLALEVGRALGSEHASRVVIGQDVRTTSPVLADATTAGVRECGVDVVRLGVVATPTVSRAIDWHDADAGVVVTASHNPPTDNGLKLMDETGQALVGESQTAIVERLEREAYDVAPWDELGDVEYEVDSRGRHAAAITEGVADLDLEVVLDVGNGTGTVTADALRRAGCTVRTVNADPDGRFPARPSEPTAEHCSHLATVVAGTDADLGIAHDGDADRAMAVTESGTFVPGDVLLAVFARTAATEDDAVAVPIDTSMAVTDALESIGASTTYTRVGDGYVADRATDDGVVFGGEPSGAWIWPSESRCPDGPLAAVRLAELVAADGSLDRVVEAIDTVPIRRAAVETDDRTGVVEYVRNRVVDRYPNVTNVDGVRVDVDDGWFLVRASGTQPIVRITAEARSAERMDSLFQTASDLVAGGVEMVDTSR